MGNTSKYLEFKNNGFVIIENFFDIETEIKPILYDIYRIIGLFIKKYDLKITQDKFSIENYDKGLVEISKINRAIVAEIYDIVKQIPSFINLVSSPKNGHLFSQIRNTDMCGLGAGSYGIRIDLPFEDKYRANWHQDFLAQFGSEDGIVFWTPLINLERENGPVEFCVKSHLDGIRNVVTNDFSNGKTGAYSIKIHNEESIISQYERIAPLSKLGDLVLIDFLTLHASGYNVSERARITIQYRYFNFLHKSGYDLGWTSGYGTKKTIELITPEYIVSN
jgi:hypothetical protein